MIYRSNLTAPDLVPSFKHVRSEPEPGSFGHDVIHDWADGGYPIEGEEPPGFLTHDEAAILFNVALRTEARRWLDIGAHSGWTVAHVAAAGKRVTGVDPILRFEAAQHRMESNIKSWWRSVDSFSHMPSERFFRNVQEPWRGCLIDGDHAPGKPVGDAMGAVAHMANTIVFHDFIGSPVQEAVTWLMNQGFKARVYFTPFMLAVCWRGEFTPPNHTPDPNLPDLKARCPGFDFARCT